MSLARGKPGHTPFPADAEHSTQAFFRVLLSFEDPLSWEAGLRNMAGPKMLLSLSRFDPYLYRIDQAARRLLLPSQ